MLKVLFVDHDPQRSVEMNKLLSQSFHLETAFNGWEGLGSAMLSRPDIILLNLNVAVMDGVELLRLLRSEEDLADLPVLGFTEPHNPSLENQALAVACNGLLEYPFNPTTLCQRIQSACLKTNKDPQNP